MPIFMAMVMILWMVSGMVLLHEVSFYSTGEVAIIFGSFLICLLGVYVLTLKIKMQRLKDKADNMESLLH